MAQLDRQSGLVGNTAMKAPCRAATTANITLSGEQTIDGVACVTDDRVLVKDQTTGANNGIYVVSTGTWERADDWDGSYDIVCGTFIYVTSGTVNASTNWRITTANPITIGTTSVAIAAAFGSLALANDTHAATNKATIVDADEAPLADSAASWVLKRWTFANLWTYIQTKLSTNAGTITVTGTGLAKLDTSGDITAYRTDGTTGVIFLNSALNKFLHNDGTNYQLPGQGLVVGGAISGTTITGSSIVRGNTTTGATTSAAVVGVASTSGNGVFGQSDSSFGVYAVSNSGSAVRAVSTSGIGVFVQSTGNYAAYLTGDSTSPAFAALHIDTQDAQPSGPNVVGDIYVTTAGVLKICTVAGTPGTWVSVGTQT